MPSIRLEISRQKAKALSVGDKIRAVVLGEVLEVESMQPIGEGPEATDLPPDLPVASTVIDVSFSKIRKRSEDEQEEVFAALGMDEDEEED